MDKIIEYNTVIGGSINELELGVNYNIDEGWIPLGGIAIHPLPSKEMGYVQAMVKYAGPIKARPGMKLPHQKPNATPKRGYGTGI